MHMPMGVPAFGWPYPSPPVSPNMLLPGQVQQLMLYNLVCGIGVGEIVAHFQNENIVVENVVFTRMATPNQFGEAMVTVRSRTPSDPPMVDPQYLTKIPMDPTQFVPATMPMAMPPQQLYTVIQSS